MSIFPAASASVSPDALLRQLGSIVGSDQLISDAEATTSFTVDWTGKFRGSALAVVMPGDSDQIAAVMRACSLARIPILPQGGNTGLVGGGVPSSIGPPPVIISTRRLVEVEPVDTIAGLVRVGAGVTLAALQRQAEAAGWRYGVDLAARASATVGGMIATNAGGIRVCAYGMTRAQVLGLQVVLADGSVINSGRGLIKDNAGYDLTGLFVGSEGTLGLITAATLRLHRPPGRTTLALAPVSDYSAALKLVAQASPPGQRLLAAEIMDHSGVSAVCRLAGLGWPISDNAAHHLLLLEVTGPEIRLPNTSDAVVALEPRDAGRLWRYRELQSEVAVVSREPGEQLNKLDVSVPLRKLRQFSDELASLLARLPGVRRWSLFGHVADGNLHVQLVGADCASPGVEEPILKLVAALGGSISAEHGIGQAKVSYLSLSRSASELAAMKAIKQVFDPDGVMAPGVIFGS